MTNSVGCSHQTRELDIRVTVDPDETQVHGGIY